MQEVGALAAEYTPFQSAPFVPFSSSDKKKDDAMATGIRVDTMSDLEGAGIKLPKRLRPGFDVHQEDNDNATKRRRSRARASTTSAPMVMQVVKRKPLAVLTPAEANSGQRGD